MRVTMMRTDLTDTADWAHREMVRRLRAMSPRERLEQAIRMTEDMLAVHRQTEARLGKRIPLYKEFAHLEL